MIGNYIGTLSNRGERLLTEPKEVLRNGRPIAIEPLRIPVDEVTYHDSAAWGEWTDAGGSSLELRDPRSDNRHPGNWASSDESEKSEWVNVTGEGPIDKTRGQMFASNYLQLFCWIKGNALSTTVYDAGTNAKRVSNPGFEKSGKGSTPAHTSRLPSLRISARTIAGRSTSRPSTAATPSVMPSGCR